MSIEKLYEKFWNHYSPKIIAYKEKEKIERFSLSVCIIALAGFFLLGIINPFFMILVVLALVGSLFFFSKLSNTQNDMRRQRKLLINAHDLILYADERERAKDYDSAIETWEKLNEINEAARVRTLKAELGSVKVSQSVVQGDHITKTEVKDSVLNRSNIGGSPSKMQELEKLTEMKKEGLIDDAEFKQMKKEILGK